MKHSSSQLGIKSAEVMATAGDGEKRWPHQKEARLFYVYKPTRSPLTSLSFGLGLGGVPLLHPGLYPAGRRSPLSSFALPFDRIIEGTAGVPRPGDERALKLPWPFLSAWPPARRGEKPRSAGADDRGIAGRHCGGLVSNPTSQRLRAQPGEERGEDQARA
jgi:hypothetical protein